MAARANFEALQAPPDASTTCTVNVALCTASPFDELWTGELAHAARQRLAAKETGVKAFISVGSCEGSWD